MEGIQMSGVLLQPRFRNKPVFYTAYPVGPIGDVHQIVRFKQSCPELPMRYGATFATARVGQNVQDGDSPSFNTGAYGPKAVISAFDRPSNVTTSGGFTYENIIPEDREVIADTIALPSYDWQNLVAETYKAKVTGNAFLPLPGGFKPEAGDIPRGGQVPTSGGSGADTFMPLGGSPTFNPNSYYEPTPERNPDGSNYLQAPDIGVAYRPNPMAGMLAPAENAFAGGLGAFGQRRGFY
jgi:hypothetical protein